MSILFDEQRFIDESMGLEMQRDFDDFYKSTWKIPLGTKEPYDNYNGESTDDDWVFWEITPKEVFNIFIGSRAGTHKSVLMKRFMTYYYYKNFKITYFDPKSTDTILAKRFGSGRRSYKRENPVKLPVVGCLPSFVSRQTGFAPLPADIISKYEYYFTLDFRSITERAEWQTLLGTTQAGTDALIRLAPKCKSFNQLTSKIKDDKDVHVGSAKSLRNILESWKVDQVFNAKGDTLKFGNGTMKDIKYKFINIARLWNKGLIPDIAFMERAQELQKIVVTKVLQQQMRYSETHNVRKLNIHDDCMTYLNDPNDTCSQLVSQTINLGRTKKFNNIFAVQNPVEFNGNIIDVCKDKFIGDLGNPEQVRKYFTKEQYDIIRNLHYDDSQRPKIDVEYAWFGVDRRKYQTFYVAGSPCGHTW